MERAPRAAAGLRLGRLRVLQSPKGGAVPVGEPFHGEYGTTNTYNRRFAICNSKLRL